MIRARFHANYDDWRPITFPPPGPAWCTGYAGDESHSIVVAYLNDEDEIKTYWPEASNIEYTESDKIIFTDRFARPDWWPEGQLTIGAHT